MLVCGQEEPLRANEQLHSFDEQTSAITLSLSDNPRLNRYSFVWLGEPSETATIFSELLHAIITPSHTTCTWVQVWQHHLKGDQRIRARWLLSKRNKEGWLIYHDATFAVATKPVAVDSAQLLEPQGYTWRDGSFLLLLGPAPSVEELSREPLRSSLEMFAWRTELAPSPQFLNWLADHQQSIVYSTHDDLGRGGLIIVGATKIQTAALQAQGIIQEIKTEIEAPAVWRSSWL